MIKNIVFVIQIIISAILIFLIVIQSKGTGLSSSIIGGTGGYSTKRGVEKFIFYLTIGISFLFFFSSIILLVVK